MDLISRFIRTAKLDAAAEERAERESQLRDAERTVITVRRLPGAACWDLLVDGEKIVASPNLALDHVLDEVRKTGGRAVVEYDDQDSMSERLKRKQEGREVVNRLCPGATIAAHRDDATKLHIPCDREHPAARMFRIDDIRRDPMTGRYVLVSGLRATVPLEAHDVVHLEQPVQPSL